MIRRRKDTIRNLLVQSSEENTFEKIDRRSSTCRSIANNLVNLIQMEIIDIRSERMSSYPPIKNRLVLDTPGLDAPGHRSKRASFEVDASSVVYFMNGEFPSSSMREEREGGRDKRSAPLTRYARSHHHWTRFIIIRDARVCEKLRFFHGRGGKRERLYASR